MLASWRLHNNPRLAWVGACCAALLWCWAAAPTGLRLLGQDDAGPAPVAPPPATDLGAPAEPAEPAAAPEAPREGINFFYLLLRGGWFMVPIAGMAVVFVTFAIERLLALRASRVLPSVLVQQLGQLAQAPGGFDPRHAYRVCQRFPSSAASVIQTLLLKVGRPHSEVEHAVQEASQREADKLYSNVRWLNLCAAVTPLLGLLGTVWGLIVAFHDTTNLEPGQNKADFLAGGIYEALVTTLGGLMVAIPATIVAHYFEGVIESRFRTIDEMVTNLTPLVERFEGKVRFSRQVVDGEPPPEPAAPTPPRAKA